MASAFKTPDGWTANIVPHRNENGRMRKNIRIPKDCIDPSKPKESALAYADECEAVITALEKYGAIRDLVDEALRLKAISKDCANRITGKDSTDVDPRDDEDPTRLTIERAFEIHRTTRHERKMRAKDYDRGVAAVDEFIRFCREKLRKECERVKDIRAGDVQAWVDYMAETGSYGVEKPKPLRFDSIRHKLNPIRRACRVGSSIGIGDRVDGMIRMPERERVEIAVWTPLEMARIILAMQAAGEARHVAVVALGGFMGLRPTEIIRVRVSDFTREDDQVYLQIGAREAKNQSSVRLLPVPPKVYELIEALIQSRPKDKVLLTTVWGNPDRTPRGEFKELGNNKFWHKIKAAGVRFLPAKALRKSFVTAFERDLGPHDLEAFIGHRRSGVAPVTAQSYLAKSQARALLAASNRVSVVLTLALGEAAEAIKSEAAKASKKPAKKPRSSTVFSTRA